MPEYIFRNPATGETKSVVLPMNSEHSYSEGDIKFERVFTIPNSAVDSSFDPNDSKDFIRKTATKKGTVGDLMNLSGELSEKRKDKMGVDPLKSKYYENYSKRRNSSKHPDQIKSEAVKKLDKMGVAVD
jgi:hypothetical protein